MKGSYRHLLFPI